MRCPYCKAWVWKKRANCAECGAKLGIHNRKGPNMALIYLFISLCVGAPIGGYSGQVISYMVLFREMDTASFVVGAVFGSAFMYLFFLLHEAKGKSVK